MGRSSAAPVQDPAKTRRKNAGRMPALQLRLLEVEEYVDRMLGVVGLHPVADVVVVHRQRAENIVRLGLKLRQKILEGRFIENFTLRNAPRIAQPFFRAG